MAASEEPLRRALVGRMTGKRSSHKAVSNSAEDQGIATVHKNDGSYVPGWN